MILYTCTHNSHQVVSSCGCKIGAPSTLIIEAESLSDNLNAIIDHPNKMIVATPGPFIDVLEFFEHYNVNITNLFNGLKFVVLSEADIRDDRAVHRVLHFLPKINSFRLVACSTTQSELNHDEDESLDEPNRWLSFVGFFGVAVAVAVTALLVSQFIQMNA